MQRRLEGFQFSPDSYLQNELESSFIYDTPDQTKSTGSKSRYGSDRPWIDWFVVMYLVKRKLLFGLLKAVDNGKQVAILLPTTILAYQHYRTLRSD
jgi:transcription-repair coupling factor (superfamily II helicase)